MFAVFGVSEAICRAKAQKLKAKGKNYASKKQKDDKGNPVRFYEVDEMTEAMFDEIKPSKISPDYSGPKECHAFIELMNRLGRSRSVDIKQGTRDGPIIKGKRPRIVWSSA